MDNEAFMNRSLIEPSKKAAFNWDLSNTPETHWIFHVLYPLSARGTKRELIYELLLRFAVLL